MFKNTKHKSIVVSSIFITLIFVTSCKTGKEDAINKIPSNVVWTDTIVKTTYDSGKKQTVWAFSKNDSLIHYEWTYYENGNIYMEGGMYKNLRQGLWKAYNEEGKKISIGTFDEGSSEGLKIVWRDNGVKYYEGNFKNNKRIGDWIFYDEKGNVFKKINYTKINEEDSLKQ